MNSAAQEAIVVASGNRNKIRELQSVAEEFGLLLLSPAEAAMRQVTGPPPDVPETADSYAGNALLKARAYAEWCGLPALGDDSGLEVAALGNGPGVYSARYGGPGLSDEQRWQHLLAEVEKKLAADGSDNRSACFRCSLVLAYPGGRTLQAEGVLDGEVLRAPRGRNGFGYDPVVLIHQLQKTLAEVEFPVVCKQGFRAQAARKLFSQIAARQA